MSETADVRNLSPAEKYQRMLESKRRWYQRNKESERAKALEFYYANREACNIKCRDRARAKRAKFLELQRLSAIPKLPDPE
jgi:hypothetical protein